MSKKQKKPVFGQLTLGGVMALDWLKRGDCQEIGGITYEVSKMRFITNGGMRDSGYNIPDWADENAWCVLLTRADPLENPVWVSQKTAVEGIEYYAAQWEEQGAEICDKTRTLSLGEATVKLNFTKGHKHFDRYRVQVIE